MERLCIEPQDLSGCLLVGVAEAEREREKFLLRRRCREIPMGAEGIKNIRQHVRYLSSNPALSNRHFYCLVILSKLNIIKPMKEDDQFKLGGLKTPLYFVTICKRK